MILFFQEREEESKRLKLQKITEEAEQKRLATEYSRREEQRIRREIEERELQEAQALLLETEKRAKKKGKKPLLEGVSSKYNPLIHLIVRWNKWRSNEVLLFHYNERSTSLSLLRLVKLYFLVGKDYKANPHGVGFERATEGTSRDGKETSETCKDNGLLRTGKERRRGPTDRPCIPTAIGGGENPSWARTIG